MGELTNREVLDAFEEAMTGGDASLVLGSSGVLSIYGEAHYDVRKLIGLLVREATDHE